MNAKSPITINWAEGHDTLGAFELTLGAVVLVSYLFFALLSRVTWLATGLFYVLLAAALWSGQRLEYIQFQSVGRRRMRGTLLFGSTWIVAAGALLLAQLPIALAHARAWHGLEGWADGPIALMLALGLYYLAQGLRLHVRRWVYLGAVLCALAVLVPGITPLRESLYLSSGLLAGAALLAGAYLGQPYAAARFSLFS